MTLNIITFGPLTDIIPSAALDLQANKVQELMDELIALYPSLKTYPFQVAVNQQLAAVGTLLKEGDEIALLPPFSGG